MFTNMVYAVQTLANCQKGQINSLLLQFSLYFKDKVATLDSC